MPVFTYKTIDAAGNELSQTIEADDKKDAAQKLRTQRKVVLLLEEQAQIIDEKTGERQAYKLSFFDYLTHISSGTIAVFFRKLSALVTSGVTLVNSLYILEEQETVGKMRKIIGRIRLDVEGGSSFALALKRWYPKVFDSLVVGMIEAGEASGMLSDILDRVATTLEQRAEFKNKIITGAIYPIIVIIAVIGVVIFLVGFVIPRIAPLLKLRGTRLPWNTQFLINMSDWFKLYWPQFFASIIVALSLAYITYKLVKPLRYWTDSLKLKLPVIGPVLVNSIIVEFTRNLSILIKSGVTVLESLSIVRNIIRNRVVRKVIDTIETHILRGESLSIPIKAAKHIFPPMVAGMVAVGEETGSLDTSLEVAADIHEKILDTHVKRVAAMVEPLLILVLGGIVGFVAWALISGMLTMYHV